MKKFLVFLCAAVLLLGTAGLAKATLIDIDNWNFDELTLGDGKWDNGSVDSIPGWKLGDINRQGTWNPFGAYFQGALPSEPNVAFLNRHVDQVLNERLIGQWLDGEELVPYATYILEAEVGHRKNVAGMPFMPFGAYKVLFGIGEPGVSFVPLAWDANTLTLPSGGFETSTVTYTADPLDPRLALTEGRTLGIQLWNLGDDGTQVVYDSVRLDASLVQPVPEPATMLLLGTGLIGLAGLGRKKFFKKA